MSSDKLTFLSADTASQPVGVVAKNVEWEVQVESLATEWLTATKDGNQVVVSVKPNSSMQERSGLIKVIPTTNTANVNTQVITVTQKGSDTPPLLDVTLSPLKLDFIGDKPAMQQVTVTTIGEITWNAEPDADSKTWITLEIDGDKINVTLKDNPATKIREGNIVISTNQPSVPKKVIHVTQEAKVVPPSLSIDSLASYELKSDVEPIDKFTVKVKPVKVSWTYKVEYEGTQKDWLQTSKVADNKSNYIIFTASQNMEDEPRTAKIIISAVDNNSVAPVTATVVQSAHAPYMSDLTEDVVLADGMISSRALIYPTSQYFPASVTTTYWDLRFLGAGMKWSDTDPFVTGAGDRFEMKVRTPRINFNEDGEYWLPEGEYVVLGPKWESLPPKPNPKPVPFTIECGNKTNVFSYPSGGWYFKMDGGNYLNKAPLASGKMTVTREGRTYTIVFDLVDDNLHTIKGTFTGRLNIIIGGQEPGSNPGSGPEPGPDPVPPTDGDDPAPLFAR